MVLHHELQDYPMINETGSKHSEMMRPSSLGIETVVQNTKDRFTIIGKNHRKGMKLVPKVE